MEQTDTYRHQGMRKRLIDSLVSKGIKDQRALEAMQKVPRHFFMDSSFLEFAYQDKAFPIGSGQTISQPYTVAFQTELLELEDNMSVLEIGTGSGYQACILYEMGAKVFTVERQFYLYKKVKLFLEKHNYKIKVFHRDGYEGLPAYAPFDRVLITAALPSIPEQLKMQLKTGSVLVAPVGRAGHQTMTRLRKISEEQYIEEQHGGFVFVPMLPGKGND
jgi:protein-L-isoaspartate(D-aspartate) O-methyltransferase